MAVCKHLALSQPRLILRILQHGTGCWTKKNLLLLELKSKQTEVLCRSTFSGSLLRVSSGGERPGLGGQPGQCPAILPSSRLDLGRPGCRLTSAGSLGLGVATFLGIPGPLSGESLHLSAGSALLFQAEGCCRAVRPGCLTSLFAAGFNWVS